MAHSVEQVVCKGRRAHFEFYITKAIPESGKHRKSVPLEVGFRSFPSPNGSRSEGSDEESTWVRDVGEGRRRRQRRLRCSVGRGVVGEEATGEEEGDGGGWGGFTRRGRENDLGMAVQVGEEASHRADGREGGQGGAVVIPEEGGLGFAMGFQLVVGVPTRLQ